MHAVLYDGSFEGLLTAIFDVYDYKMTDVSIYRQDVAPGILLGSTHTVVTDKAKVARVYAKLKKQLTAPALTRFYRTFLSEITGVENTLLGYIQYMIASTPAADNNFSHPNVLAVHQISKKVGREKHRMEAFVRFKLTKDGLYYALIEPDFNVLPLILPHFKNRYADQRWLIYDSTRKYGLYYDLTQVATVTIQFDAGLNNKTCLASIEDEEEVLYQQLWQQYFGSVNIAARKNMKLHLQHMPRRYWRHLTEKLPH